MALLSIFRGTQAECSARPVSDGTLLFATDTKKIYLDKDSSRIEMSSVDDLGDYVTKEQLTTALSGKANSSHTHTKSQITDFPSSLKNPNSLTISLNGTSQGAYDGSAAKSINVTPASIGAAASSHNHSAANITSGTLSTDRLPTVPIAHGGTGATSAARARANLGLGFTRLYYNYDAGWVVYASDYLVWIYAWGVYIGSGSWDSKTCPYVLPQKYRPSLSHITTPVVTNNGRSCTSVLVAKSDGTITVSNRGGSGSDDARYGVLFYPVGV